MVVMRFYEDADLLWAEFGSGPENWGILRDDARIDHYNGEGELFAVSFLYASDGVDLDVIPEDERDDVRKYLIRVGLKERVVA